MNKSSIEFLSGLRTLSAAQPNAYFTLFNNQEIEIADSEGNLVKFSKTTVEFTQKNRDRKLAMQLNIRSRSLVVNGNESPADMDLFMEKVQTLLSKMANRKAKFRIVRK
ncbi:hypothetical protein EBR96_06000 [bacterium]|nr:hypothetical protein [bacterium]